MQNYQLVGAKGQLCVEAANIIGKLDLIDVRGKPLDDRADLAANQPLVGVIGGQGDDI